MGDPTKDFTETGLKLEGTYENDRNGKSNQLFKDVIREAYGVTDVICAHHLTFVIADVHKDGFAYQTVEEIPSADTLIFDHYIAAKIFGLRDYKCILMRLALEPIATRDELYSQLYYGRAKLHDVSPVHRDADATRA